jgi:hypothetical protein
MRPVRLPPGRLRLATKPTSTRIKARNKNDWYVPRRRFESHCDRAGSSPDRAAGLGAYPISDKRRQPLGMAARSWVGDRHVAVF